MSSTPEDMEFGLAWHAFADTIRKRYAVYESQTPDLCAAAKTLYRLRHGWSTENDYPVMAGPRFVDGNDATALRGEFMPAWASYLKEAQEVLTVISALKVRT